MLSLRVHRTTPIVVKQAESPIIGPSYRIPVSFQPPQDSLDSSISSSSSSKPEDAEDSVFDLHDFSAFEVDSGSQGEDLAQRVPEVVDELVEEEGEPQGGSPYDESRTPRPNWTVDEILRRANQRQNQWMLDSWKSMLPEEIPSGQTHALLIPDGTLARTLKLLIDEEEVDLDQIRTQGVDSCFPTFVLDEIGQRMSGGNINQRLADVRGYIECDLEGVANGTKSLFLPNFITPEEIDRCRQLADEIRSKVRSNNKPKADELFQLLAFLIIKSKHRRRFEMTHDYAIRRLGWIDDAMPREAAEAVAAGYRLGGLMRWFKEGSGKCRIAPLIRCLRKGTKLPGQAGQASIYEMLWKNWGCSGTRIMSPQSLVA